MGASDHAVTGTYGDSDMCGWDSPAAQFAFIAPVIFRAVVARGACGARGARGACGAGGAGGDIPGDRKRAHPRHGSPPAVISFCSLRPGA